MNRFVKKVLIALAMFPLMGVVVASCAEEIDCSMVNRATLNGAFYTLSESNRPVLGQQGKITLTALGTDSILLNQLQNVKNLSLPLQYTADTTALVMEFDGIWKDTIVFKHTNTPYFVSMECGYEMKQVVTGFYHTKHVLDSIALIDINTNKNGKENLQLFYTATEAQ
ncbi:DUF6452 family protein [Bacteroides sp. OttesenSCG-928-J23]|nr:DUF6452 family protein [Bacteroides sp. OttesenSCG-928-N06]MDL2247852.1 DUF6452 family protein [Bacteroides sp. OttesenSCG-928-J23]